MTTDLKCRVCNEELYVPPLLTYENSPISAQDFHNEPNQVNNNITINIYQCSKCHLIQHILPPVSYYKDVIRAVSVSPEIKKDKTRHFEQWINKNNLINKKYIEIGCGTGDYLDVIRSVGMNKIFGLEHSAKNIIECKLKELNVSQGYLDKKSLVNLKESNFDAFGIFSFMEHWPNPKQSLSLLCDLLTKDAVGIIEVPNFEMISKKGLFTEFTVDHIFYFNQSSLSHLLESCGFEIISIKAIWFDYILSVEVKKKSPLVVENFESKFKSLNAELNNYIDQFNGKEVVVWGAGHQSLTIISLSKIYERISYIVDSAKFKQNKFTSGTNIKITPPEFLNLEKPDALIIIAAGYSDEVKKIVLDQYKFIKNIAIVREDNLEVFSA
tara:strand:+ start:419 stop:1567 length:1149 start_codon:yes stop_codon:yes gene_type:complete